MQINAPGSQDLIDASDAPDPSALPPMPAADPASPDAATGAAPSSPSTDPAIPVRREPGQPGELPEPTLPPNAVGGFYAKYKADLFADKLAPTDVVQGQLGDCFLVSAMASVAETHPDELKNRVKDNGDGTYTVRFSELQADKTMKDVSITVDNELPVSEWGKLPAAAPGALPGAVPNVSADLLAHQAYAYGAHATDAGTGPLWGGIVEKAYAQWKGGYGAINNGGYMNETLTALTGEDTKYDYMKDMTDDQVWSKLQDETKNGRAIMASTYFEGSGHQTLDGLDEGHAYTVLGIEEKNGERYVQLRNPWGTHAPAGTGLDAKDDGMFELPVATFRAQYEDMIATTGAPTAPPAAPKSVPASQGGGFFSSLFGGGG